MTWLIWLESGVDGPSAKIVFLPLDDTALKGVDESNALVLPATRTKKTKEPGQLLAKKRPLTKKQRKNLEKVLELKEKKASVRLFCLNTHEGCWFFKMIIPWNYPSVILFV